MKAILQLIIDIEEKLARILDSVEKIFVVGLLLGIFLAYIIHKVMT